MPTVTILGAGGYIGLAVVKSFASAGWEVRAVARNAQQAPGITKAGGTPIIASVLDVSKWREAAKESSTVVMCAGSARTSPEEHRAMYDAIFQVTLETTREADMGRKTLIYTCGLAVFGNSDPALIHRNVSESSSLGEGLWPGILSRRQIEKELLSNAEVNGIVIRPGFVYGASGGPLGNSIREAITKSTITAFGDPEAPMSGIHLDDLGDAYVLAAEKGDVVRGLAFNMSNLASERRGSCYKAICRALGLPETSVTFQAAPANLQMMTRAMFAPARKAADVLGWRQRRPSFVDGIDRWVREYKVYNPDVKAAKL